MNALGFFMVMAVGAIIAATLFICMITGCLVGPKWVIIFVIVAAETVVMLKG